MILCWLDVETTGLDPARNHLLEIAIVATELSPELTAIGEPAHGIFRYPEALRLDSIHPDVLAMHASNGLWRESQDADLDYFVWNKVLGTIESWDLAGEEAMLAGRSVHFDRGWLEKQAPQYIIDALNLTHRHFDLTSIKRFAELCGWSDLFEIESPHRALPDVLDDINLARDLVRTFDLNVLNP